MSTADLDFSPLARRIRARDVNRFRRRVEPAEKRRLWPKVVGALGGLALSVFLAFYVTEGELALIPWFTIGIALLFLLAWVLVFRATGRRWRLRYRLDAFATANGLTIEYDVTEPERGWGAYGGGTTPKLVTRLIGRDRLGAYEVGILSRVEPTSSGGSLTVEKLYLISSRPDDGAPEQLITFDTLHDLGQPDTWRLILAARSATAATGRNADTP